MTDGTGCYRDSLTGYERSSYSTLFANSAYRLKPDGMGLWPSKSMMKTLVALIGNAHSTDSRCFIRNAWSAERIASGNDDCGTDADIMIQVFDDELAANWNPDGITSMILLIMSWVTLCLKIEQKAYTHIASLIIRKAVKMPEKWLRMVISTSCLFMLISLSNKVEMLFTGLFVK